MKINAQWKWLLGGLLRLALMGPLMIVRNGCDAGIRYLRHRLPGG